jgi:uncharacterized protein YbjT (DUF2867 family)
MKKIIVVVGATGDLGGKIVDALLTKGAEVRAIVRLETDAKKINALQQKGVNVLQVDTTRKSEISRGCAGAHCVVSALAGLEQTILETQKLVVDAAVDAGVKRFIPSDFSIDFTNLVEGKNRNLDFRRAFHRYLDNIPIQSTTIFNGAFMELLTGDMPLIMLKQQRILCWGHPDQPMEFTTTLDVAAFTAEAAMDEETPRYLRIAGDRLSCTDFVSLLTDLTAKKFKIFKPGGIGLFNMIIKITRFFSPSKNDLYPAWQGMQYMRDMMEGRVIFQSYDHGRYPHLQRTSVREYLISENVSRKI